LTEKTSRSFVFRYHAPPTHSGLTPYIIIVLYQKSIYEDHEMPRVYLISHLFSHPSFARNYSPNSPICIISNFVRRTQYVSSCCLFAYHTLRSAERNFLAPSHLTFQVFLTRLPPKTSTAGARRISRQLWTLEVAWLRPGLCFPDFRQAHSPTLRSLRRMESWTSRSRVKGSGL
jgi:hypothetical protein